MVPDSLGVAAVWLALTNLSARTVTITYGVCAAAAVLYAEGAQQAAWHNGELPSPSSCGPDVVWQLTLFPNGVGAIPAGRLAFGGSVPALPTGRYVAAAAFDDGGTVRLLQAGFVTCTSARCTA